MPFSGGDQLTSPQPSSRGDEAPPDLSGGPQAHEDTSSNRLFSGESPSRASSSSPIC